MRLSVPFLLLPAFCALALSSCNTLANRRDLFAPNQAEGPYTDSLAGPRSDDAFSKVYRMRYDRKISTPASGTYTEPTAVPQSDDSFSAEYRKRYYEKISTPSSGR